MPKNAATGLTDYVETIRQEAYNEGYAAAMRAVVEFSGSGTAKSKATTAKTATAKTTTGMTTARKTITRKAAKAATAKVAKAAIAKAAIAKATTAKPATASQAAPGRQRRAQTKTGCSTDPSR